MVEDARGNLLQADVEALVNTVNTVGYMGKGIALQSKQAFPGNFAAYVQAVKRGEVRPGRMLVWSAGRVTNPRYIVNFPTKRHWRGRSRIEDIEAGLTALVQEIRRLGIRSICRSASRMRQWRLGLERRPATDRCCARRTSGRAGFALRPWGRAR